MARKYLITGGAGFIGSNYVSRLLERGEQVTVFDNLSRAGARLNLEWLRKTHGDKSFELVVGDRSRSGRCRVRTSCVRVARLAEADPAGPTGGRGMVSRRFHRSATCGPEDGSKQVVSRGGQCHEV